MISKDIEPYLQEIIKYDMEKVFFANWVEKINRHQNIQKRLLIFTDVRIYQCRLKAFSKVPQLKKSYSWFKLTTVELNEPKTIIFTFKNNDGFLVKKFISDVPYAIIDFVGQQIVNIENPQEYPQFVVPHFSFLKYPISIFSGLNRLKAKILYDNPPNDEILSLFESYSLFLNSGSTIFVFGMFSESQYSGLILDSLCIVPHVTTVVFPDSQNPKTHWGEFCYLLEHAFYVNEVITNEQIDQNFDLIQQISSNTFSGVISSITFGSQFFREHDLSIIIKLYQTCSIPNIKFSQNKFETNPSIFAPLFASNSQFFTSLTFDKIPNFDFSRVITSLLNIKHVGITSCHLDLGKLLPTICSFKNCKIQSFDLSGNFCHSLRDGDECQLRQLPDSITEFIIDDFIFYGNSARDFLSFIIHQKNRTHFSLSMKKMSIEKEMWKPLFKFMLKHSNEDKFDYPITKFSWDGNELNFALFSFLGRCKNLSFLSLNGCFGSTNCPKLVQYLLSFISCTKTCKELNMGGTIMHRIPSELLEMIFNALKSDQRVIKKINLSGHNYRPETLTVLSDTLMANRFIEYVDFSSNGILKKEAWDNFFRRLVSRGKTVDFPIPQNEFAEMIQTKIISHEELEDFTSLINLIKRRNSQVKLPPDSILPPLGFIDQKEIEKLNGFDVNTQAVKPADDLCIESVTNNNITYSSLIAQLKDSFSSS